MVGGVVGGLVFDAVVGAVEFAQGEAEFAQGVVDGAVVDGFEPGDLGGAGFGGEAGGLSVGFGRAEAEQGLERVALAERADAVVEVEGVGEQQVVDDLAGELDAVGFEQGEVGGDGGVGDAEVLGDASQGLALLAELVCLADAVAALWGGGHMRTPVLVVWSM